MTWAEIVLSAIAYTAGFIAVFGTINFVWNKIDDWKSGRASSPVRPTGRVIKVGGDEMVEYEVKGDPSKTAFRMRKK